MADNFFGITDTGKLRDNNEDAFVAQKQPAGFVLACVIDGVGGYEGGEIAASIAKDTITKKLSGAFTNATLALEEAVWEANKAIYNEKQSSADYKNMACVITAALADVENNQFYYAHVGDTRMYLLRDGSLVKVTKDHSFVGFLEDSGRLSEKEAMQHPKRNEINKALGFDGTIQLDSDYIETGSSPFLPGDLLLLCSDGLTDLVTNKAMTDILLSSASLSEKGQALIDAANNAGGKDNITVVLVVNDKKPLKAKATKPVRLIKKKQQQEDINDTIEPPFIEPEPPARGRSNGGIIAVLSLLCLLLAGSTYWFWKESKDAEKPDEGLVVAALHPEEKALADSLALDTKTFTITDSGASKTIIISDTIFIRQDSLHVVGNSITLRRDSAYNGPVFFVSANCKYLLLDGITFNDFSTAIVMQGKGLNLRHVVFQNVQTPVQKQVLFSSGDTLNGVLRDSFIIKKDTIHK